MCINIQEMKAISLLHESVSEVCVAVRRQGRRTILESPLIATISFSSFFDLSVFPFLERSAYSLIQLHINCIFTHSTDFVTTDLPCDLRLLDNAPAFAASICIKLSRAQLLDAPQHSKLPRRNPNMLCEDGHDGSPDQSHVCIRVTQYPLTYVEHNGGSNFRVCGSSEGSKQARDCH